MSYQDHITATNKLIRSYNGTWDGISAESVARMRLQNRFKSGLDIARYTAAIMRKDMAAYDADPANYTQSLGCWHGFIGQQKMISIKKHFGTTKGRYLYLSGWMIAALRSDFGPLPDQSMHEKTSVPALIEELYTFLRQADARELGMMFRDLDAAREAGEGASAGHLVEHRDVLGHAQRIRRRQHQAELPDANVLGARGDVLIEHHRIVRHRDAFDMQMVLGKRHAVIMVGVEIARLLNEVRQHGLIQLGALPRHAALEGAGRPDHRRVENSDFHLALPALSSV